MAFLGELSEISGVEEFEWKSIEWRIKEFTSLSVEVDRCYDSPVFSFAGESLQFVIFPNGRKEDETMNSEGSIGLYIYRTFSGPPIFLEFSLGLKTLEGKVNPQRYQAYNFKKIEGKGFYDLISRSELLEKKSELLPSDVLTIVCKIKYPKAADNSSNTGTEKCSYCKSTLDAHEDLSSHQQKCMDKPIKCPECRDVVALKDWYGHKCQKTGAEATEKLLHDFKTIMLEGVHSDMVVKVKGEEFRLHKNILAGRNPYFDSMFKTDMKEKSSGVVTIEDCEPYTFRSFVHFIYTGKVDRLSLENVCSLYETADKYQEDQLKNECLHFMMNTLSVDSFCDYFALALRHEEKELFQKGVELFTTESKEIARSVKWQVFVQEFPIQANELFIKTLDRHIK